MAISLSSALRLVGRDDAPEDPPERCDPEIVAFLRSARDRGLTISQASADLAADPLFGLLEPTESELTAAGFIVRGGGLS